MYYSLKNIKQLIKDINNIFFIKKILVNYNNFLLENTPYPKVTEPFCRVPSILFS